MWVESEAHKGPAFGSPGFDPITSHPYRKGRDITEGGRERLFALSSPRSLEAHRAHARTPDTDSLSIHGPGRVGHGDTSTSLVAVRIIVRVHW